MLLYHPWLDGFETYFVRHLSWLKDHGFETISLEDLLHYVRGGRAFIPDRPIVMTFDDGTIENYTVVYPLFKEYGFMGTVFSPTADRYIRNFGKDWWKEVETQGILRIEGHSHTHALSFVNDHVEDFYRGRKKSTEPMIKGLDERLGSPLFGLGYELICQRFIPAGKFVERCVNYVEREGGEAFFERENWREELSQVVSTYRGERGQLERREEKNLRIGDELEDSRIIIEGTIGPEKRVHFFAYPFGAHDSELIDGLKHSDYKGAFTTHPGGNVEGDNPYLLKRMMILAEDSFGGLEKILNEYL